MYYDLDLQLLFLLKEGSTPLNISYKKQDTQSFNFLIANTALFNFVSHLIIMIIILKINQQTILLYDSAVLGDRDMFIATIASGASVSTKYTVN